MEVGLSPGDFVLDGDPVPFPQKGAEPPPQFSAHFYCGQTARCIKMPLGMDVGLSPGDFVLDGDPVLPPEQRGGGHIVLDGFPALRERRTASIPSFRPMSIAATVPISATAELLLHYQTIIIGSYLRSEFEY